LWCAEYMIYRWSNADIRHSMHFDEVWIRRDYYGGKETYQWQGHGAPCPCVRIAMCSCRSNNDLRLFRAASKMP
jgi:hypothetical protein